MNTFPISSTTDKPSSRHLDLHVDVRHEHISAFVTICEQHDVTYFLDGDGWITWGEDYKDLSQNDGILLHGIVRNTEILELIAFSEILRRADLVKDRHITLSEDWAAMISNNEAIIAFLRETGVHWPHTIVHKWDIFNTINSEAANDRG